MAESRKSKSSQKGGSTQRQIPSDWSSILGGSTPTPSQGTKKSKKLPKKRKLSQKARRKLSAALKRKYRQDPSYREKVKRNASERHSVQPILKVREKPVYSIDVSTLESVLFSNHSKCAEYFGISRWDVSYYRINQTVWNGTAFSLTEKVDLKGFRNFNRWNESAKRKIFVKNLITGVVEAFSSSSECFRLFRYSKDYVNRLARNNERRIGYIFSYESEIVEDAQLLEGSFE